MLRTTIRRAACFQRSYATDAGKLFNSILAGEIEAIKQAGTYKSERIIVTPQNASISVSSRDSPVLNFCANNYLGLADNPEIIQAGIEYTQKYGAGLSSVRFICGTQNIHKELEKQVAAFHKMEDCIIYPSCFDANAGIFEAILTPEDAIISDELNHASIIDGVRLSKAKRYRYKHMDLADLDAKLKEAFRDGARTRMVVTDGVFSMDGDVAPVDELSKVCEQNG
jgi:glycine C-acetyltransferase